MHSSAKDDSWSDKRMREKMSMFSPAARVRKCMELASSGLACLLLSSMPAWAAQAYLSVEPIPSPYVVGQDDLKLIMDIGYPKMEAWSKKLDENCKFVTDAIRILEAEKAITTLSGTNFSYKVAAGGSDGGDTDPSYVFSMRTAGEAAVSAEDIYKLDNALGFVLNQTDNLQFTLPFAPGIAHEHEFQYAAVTFEKGLTGEQAAAFFRHLGDIDKKLASSEGAGSTQVMLDGRRSSDTIVFLKGSVPTSQFTSGLLRAVRTTPGAQYHPMAPDGAPATSSASGVYPGNDWVKYPQGDGFLLRIQPLSSSGRRALTALRMQHLMAVNDLLEAIRSNHLDSYLAHGVDCGAQPGQH